MSTPASNPRRIVFGAVAVGALAAAAASAAPATSPQADAAPAACTASGLATVASGVLSAAGGFLDNHPAANDVLTQAANKPPADAKSSVQGYFLGHPDEFLQLQNIAQPLMDLRSQCGVSLSPTQLATLMDTIAG